MSVSLIIPITAEPWTAPGVGKGGHAIAGGKMQAYKDALREYLADYDRPVLDGDLSLRMWFWRRIESGNTGTGRRKTAQRADATNLQKATEDALQGILFDNDRSVVHVESWVVDQGPNTTSQVVIMCGRVHQRPEPNVLHRADLWSPPSTAPAHETERPDFNPKDVF
jgi:Holliday junction resolvase RusA-like endonuclease